MFACFDKSLFSKYKKYTGKGSKINMLKKVLFVVLILIAVCVVDIDGIKADNNIYTNDRIPEIMEPYTEIEFISDNKYKIIKGSIEESIEIEPVNSTPRPQKGMKITYASDGLIQTILLENKTEPDYSGLNDAFNENMEIMPFVDFTPDLPLGRPFAKWGSANNALYQLGEWVYGHGRATTFNDEYGQSNIKNYKGSVATKLAYDNCPVNTVISVTGNTADGSEKIVSMVKTDAGGMPNAVLDIWKTGVEFWGYKWSSSFSMPQKVIYRHR